MAQSEFGGYCPHCDKRRLFRYKSVNHVLHAILTIFLCGLWAPVWVAIAIAGNGSPLCTTCGSLPK
jgi:hypothetical protein